MPTYSYACTECDNRFDVVQSFTDQSLTVCPKCEGRLRKLFSSVGIVFKGSGFYRTDSRPGEKADVPAGGDGAGKENAGKTPGTKDGGSKDGGSSGSSGSKDAGSTGGAATPAASGSSSSSGSSGSGSSTSSSSASTS